MLIDPLIDLTVSIAKPFVISIISLGLFADRSSTVRERAYTIVSEIAMESFTVNIFKAHFLLNTMKPGKKYVSSN